MGVADRLFKFAWRRIDRFFSAVDISPEPLTLHDFGVGSTKSLAGWRVFSDANFGGLSKVDLTHCVESRACVFSGQYSRELPDECTLVRSGYCGINYVHARNLNLQRYDYLEFRLRGDGHTYVTSVRVDQLTGGDEEAWQAPLPTLLGSEWQDVRVQLKDFIFSFRGRQLTSQDKFSRMPQHNVVALGITLSASEDMPITGDFKLEIQRISAGANQVDGEDKVREGYGRRGTVGGGATAAGRTTATGSTPQQSPNKPLASVAGDTASVAINTPSQHSSSLHSTSSHSSHSICIPSSPHSVDSDGIDRSVDGRTIGL